MIQWGYAIALIVAAIISSVVAYIAWARRSTRASRQLAFIMLAMSWWSLTYSFFWLRLPPQGYFWLDATYFGVVAVPIALLAFELEFFGRGHLFTPRLLALLLIEPLITLILIWTDPWHGFFFGGRPEGLGAILSGGAWFYFHVAYTYIFLLYCFGLIALHTIRYTGIYRSQNVAVLVGGAIPIAVNILSLAGLSPFPNLDLTPITFTATGLIFAFALFRLGLLDLVPVARDSLVELMGDAVIVLDAKDNLVDINPAAFKLLGITAEKAIGQKSGVLLERWPELSKHLSTPSPVHNQMQVDGAHGRYLDLRITPMLDNTNRLNGRLIVLRDVSRSVQVENELRQANLALIQKIGEIESLQEQLKEQAIRDPLTGLFNRRYLEETLGREIAKSKRSGEPLSVAMVDVDHFKSFNDRYGHAMGDSMLQHLAAILTANTREEDFVCRYGGEEFAVVLPGAPEDVTLKRMEICRQVFATEPFALNGVSLKATFSAGISSFPHDAANANALLDRADQALYLAKQKGRNRVCSTSDLSGPARSDLPK